MSSGQKKMHYGFNAKQIKDGHIVILRKDGTVKSVLDTYPPTKDK
jgi:hypothetical protein